MSNSLNFPCHSSDDSRKVCLEVKLNKYTEKNDIFPYGDQLGYIYPVLERIFSYLRFTDLENIMKLNNKYWSKVLHNELRKRYNITWLYIKEVGRLCKVEESPNFNYDNVQFIFLIYNRKRLQLSMLTCLHYKDNSVEQKTFNKYINENVFTPGANYCLLSTIIVHPLLHETDFNTLLSTVTLPKIENIRIEISVLNYNTPKINLSNDEKYVCLLVFKTCYGKLGKSLNKLLKGYSSEDVALCGGVTSEIVAKSVRLVTKRDIFCIAFIEIGLSNFKAYSIVIPESDVFEEQVKNFKDNITIHNNTIIFKVTCVAKTGKSDENQVLHKIFPNVPILGMDADGEYGWNKFDNSADYGGPSAKRNAKFPTSDHGFTTVLALLTWQS